MKRKQSDREKKIDTYRAMRKAETGNMMTRATAIDELLDAALVHIQPAIIVEYPSLVARVAALESKIERYCPLP